MRLTPAFAALAIASAMTAPALAETTYVSADRFIDPADGKVIRNAAFMITDGKITARGTKSTLKAPKSGNIIEFGSGSTMMPGFIDMHVHLTGDPTDGPYYSLSLSDERKVLKGAKNARLTLLAGFTTVRNVGADSYGDVALRDSINAGEVPGPRMYVSGPPVGIVGGHCSDNNLLPSEYALSGEGVATGPWEFREKVRENIKYGVDLIKTCSTGGVFSKGTALGAAQGTLEELTAAAEEAHARGLKIASHAHGTIGIRNAILAGIDTIEHASILDDETIQLAKDRGVWLSMDIYNTEYTLSEGEKNGVLEESLNKERAISKIQRDSFTRAVDAGVKMVFGSDSGVYPHGLNGNQFSRMVTFGMTPMQALQAATVNAADALGKAGVVGCVDVGCSADFVAVKGDPLEDISILSDVDFVMKEGVVYKVGGKAQGDAL
ncbi:metal-dependent hydrolase family protein [Hyphomonas jannaschiana]|uniref:Amidohydrolase family protein n=1 Tax=Hyphomonas jannaschiana VP2 TaxID=1280952 RepID=A0A059F8E0_9PROT|nr:amidohydrolase family protein [Hyphomonas jannaschiana]KCZ86855.1 amidohydrolase family protein [Hyphomonas jannaschiana VP2]